MDKEQLEYIRNYIIDNIMRNSDIMFSDECRDNVDLPSIIASLYEYLHRCVTGEKYNYMFHWANKCGAWVDDDIFTTEMKEQSTCIKCKHSIECVMYEPNMKRCFDYKEQKHMKESEV